MQMSLLLVILLRPLSESLPQSLPSWSRLPAILSPVGVSRPPRGLPFAVICRQDEDRTRTGRGGRGMDEDRPAGGGMEDRPGGGEEAASRLGG